MKTFIGAKSISVQNGVLTVRRSIYNDGFINQVEYFAGTAGGTIVRRPTVIENKVTVTDKKGNEKEVTQKTTVLRYFYQTWNNGQPDFEACTDEQTIADVRAEFASTLVGNMWAALDQQAKANAPQFVDENRDVKKTTVGPKAEGQISQQGVKTPATSEAL